MASVFPHAGPASYTQITRGTVPAPATGGDTVQAVEAGFGRFESVLPAMSDTGNYLVIPIPVSRSAVTGQQTTTYRLKWVAQVTASLGGQSQTINTDAAASTDLSGEIVRLTAFGYK
jgi:hypothetical protein